MIYWDDQRLDFLISSWKKNKTAGEIAAYLGITRGKVMGKVHRLQKQGKLKKKSDFIEQPITTDYRAYNRAKYKFALKPVSDKYRDPKSGTRKLHELDNKKCHFPFGDPLKEGFGYCGEPVFKGSYCKDCHDVMFKKEVKDA